MRIWAGLIVTILSLSTAQRAAAADTSVIVLGLRSLEGDDDFANGMTEGLRSAAKGIAGWRVIERAVSMSQMSLAYNCDDIDTPCLNSIAKGLDADRIVFGTVRRTGSKTKFDYEITVSIFNSGTHTIVATETEVVARAEGKVKRALGQHSQMLIGRLAASDANAGRLSIEVNVSSADVTLDGRSSGQTRDGKLVLDNVTPGMHTLEVHASGHQPHIQQLNVSASDQSSVNIELDPIIEPIVAGAPGEATSTNPDVDSASGGSSLAWLGYTLIGLGAASAIAWGGSMYMIEFQYNRDSTYQNYRDEGYESRSIDACDAAIAGDMGNLSASQLKDFQGQCRTARTFQVLQWVFLGVAVAAAGAGTYVLIADGANSDRRQARRKQPRARQFALTPQVDQRNIALTATLRF
jgi:TolB-like protein